jgi:hypothetical protein
MNSLLNKIFFLFGLGILLVSQPIFAQNTSFSGNWLRNTEKSNPGELSINSIPVSIEVSQSDKTIRIKRTSKNRLGETTISIELINCDGSLAESSPTPNLKKTASIQWLTDQRSFIETASYQDNHGSEVQKIKETWNLMNENKTLHLSTVIELDGQTFNLEEIYDKQ